MTRKSCQKSGKKGKKFIFIFERVNTAPADTLMQGKSSYFFPPLPVRCREKRTGRQTDRKTGRPMVAANCYRFVSREKAPGTARCATRCAFVPRGQMMLCTGPSQAFRQQRPICSVQHNHFPARIVTSTCVCVYIICVCVCV